MSSPKSSGGPVREGTRVVLKEITASLHNSPPIQPPRRKNGNDSPAAKTAEHEVKVRFAREFADVGSAVTENNDSTPENLSSAGSFRSLSSTFSKSNSCADSTPGTPGNTSYVNTNIPGVEDLISACANIHLRSDSQDLSQDQTFASAVDEASFHASDCSFDENLSDNGGDEARVIVTNGQLHETTERATLYTTCTFESTDNALLAEDTRLPSPSAEETHAPLVKESVEKPAPLRENANGESEPCDGNIESNQVNDDQLNATIILPDDPIPDVSEFFGEEQTVESYRSAETLPPEKSPSPIKISVPSISPLQRTEEDPSVAFLCHKSSPVKENSDSKAAERIIHDEESTRDTSPTSFSASGGADKESFVLPQVHVNSSVAEAEEKEIIEDLPRLDNCAAADNETDGTRLPNVTSVAEPKAPGVPKRLEESVDKRDVDLTSIAVSIETPTFLSKDDIAICDESRVSEERGDPSETVVIESAAPTDALKKKEGSSFEELDRTLTLQKIEDIDLTAEEEHYEEFKPQRQSTTLSSLIGEQSDFEKFRSTAEQLTNELLNPTAEFTEDTEQFVSATSEIFQDPSTFDFLLARSNSNYRNINRLRTESLYVKFDPLVSNTSMLPQGNTQPINEEQNGKNESPPSNVGTPIRNSAIAAIDRLLFYSPLPNRTVQKLDETQEKIEQPIEESEAPLIANLDMSKELGIVRASVLKLEEELEKQKKEHAAELERQKAAFQEKINKLQAQMAQEVKTKTQMTLIVEEYEKSISTLHTERERDRMNFEQEKAKLQEELQAANHHLTNTEAAFNDVHQKYERLKGVVSAYKNNEAVLKESIEENGETIKTLETRYDQLKEHALTQLEKANVELDDIRKQNEAETVKLHAMIRKAELKSNSLAELVEQKTKENKELAKILDEVIARVGHGNTE